MLELLGSFFGSPVLTNALLGIVAFVLVVNTFLTNEIEKNQQIYK